MKEFSITIPGFKIAAKAWGNINNPPILALHGWLDNANSFALIAPYLQQKFYLIAIDLPGHGYSSHLPAGCSYHFIDALLIVGEIIHALKFEKIHLLGHSLGACIASMLAGINPAPLLSLYLIDAFGPLSAQAETTKSQLATYHRLYRNLEKRFKKTYPSLEQAALTRAHKGYINIEAATILCERSLIAGAEGFSWRHDPRLLLPSPLRLTEEQVLSCLSQINLPSELLWANKGFTFDQAQMEKRLLAVRKMKVIQLEGGHHLHMEQPAKVAHLLADFYGAIS